MGNKNKYMVTKQKSSGFTLIELLVVIAIIGILSSVAVIGLNSATNKARDAETLSTIKSLQAVAITCLYTNNELLCQSGECDGASGTSAPVAYQPICLNNNNIQWPSFDNYDWQDSKSSTAELRFCFEIKKTDEEEYFSCTEISCQKTTTIQCGCVGVFESPCYSNFDCCSNNCLSGICGPMEQQQG